MAFLRGFTVRFLLPLSMLVLPLTSLSAQRIESMEFHDKPIADILLGLAELSGKSIIPDETVTGRASYYFSKTDFDTALRVFLSTYNLYLTVEDGFYHVSRVKTVFDPLSQTLAVDGEDVEIASVLNSVSRSLGKTILYDPLPSEPITLHAKMITPDNLLDLIVRKLRGFEIEAARDYYYIKKIAPKQSELAASALGAVDYITLSDNLVTISQTKKTLFEILDELFRKTGKEYSLISRRDVVLDRVRYRDKSLDQLLRIILDQVNMDFQVVDGIYYIFEISQKNVLNKLRSTVSVPLSFVSAEEIMKLLPQDILAARAIKADAVSNSLLITGTGEENQPVLDFIKKVDRPLEGNRFYRFDLSFIKADAIKALLPPAFRGLEFNLIPETNSFVLLLPENKKRMLDGFLDLLDRKTDVAEIRLKYIKSEDLISHLPPSVSKDDIIETGDPSVVFFRGSKEKQETFRRELAVLDQPVPQIKYQLLIVQFSESNTLNWQNQANTFAQISYPKDGYHAFTGNFGHLLGLNFDVFSTLGAKLSMQLNLALSTNEANILTDTTLSSLSGETVKFQDTDTYRYRDLEVVNGEERKTGVTREVTAGLIVNIQGWVSGDGMITMEVDATVSKRGVDTSSTVAELPPTTEKKVATRVRTSSGKPVILSGLYRWDTTTIIGKTPVLGDIPILGLLFQKRTETKTKSEIVIYIMPHLEEGDAFQDESGRLERLYQDLFLSALRRESYRLK